MNHFAFSQLLTLKAELMLLSRIRSKILEGPGCKNQREFLKIESPYPAAASAKKNVAKSANIYACLNN